MKLNCQLGCLGMVLCAISVNETRGQTKAAVADPFGGPPSKPPVYDDAYYAKQAKEDQEGWRAFLKRVGEPDLESLKGTPGVEIYRFVNRPWFSKTLLLTMKKKDGKPCIDIVRLSEEEKGVELRGSATLETETFDAMAKHLLKPEVRDPLAAYTLRQRDALLGLDGA